MKPEKLKIFVFALLLLQPAFLFAQNSLDFSVRCIGKDSIQVDVRNIGKEQACFHVPGDVESFLDEKNVARFIPKYSKHLAHKDGRPFDFVCLAPQGESTIEQEYMRTYRFANPFKVPADRIRGFSFAVGSPDEFSPLMKIGPKDYREQCEYLKGLQRVFVDHCKKD